jgi:cytoskeletal protein RodZ
MSVADQLRQAREAQNLTLQQVGEVTKIRTDHLRALEEGDFDVFSAPVYIRGFVRCYATMLKLDVPKIMAGIEAELGETKKFSEPPPLSDRPRGVLDFLMLQLSRIDWRKGVVVLGILIVGGIAVSIYSIVQHRRNADPLAGLKPGLYHGTQSISGQTLPLPTQHR